MTCSTAKPEPPLFSKSEQTACLAVRVLATWPSLLMNVGSMRLTASALRASTSGEAVSKSVALLQVRYNMSKKSSNNPLENTSYRKREEEAHRDPRKTETPS